MFNIRNINKNCKYDRNKTYAYLYKITNNINNKFYIGIHSGYPEDNYMGSGKLIWKAIDKYGLNNFTKIIIKTFPDNEIGRNKVSKLEAFIVNVELTKSFDCYNIATGGSAISTGMCRYFVDGKLELIHTDDPKIQKLNLKHQSSGTTLYKNIETGDIRMLSKDDELVKSGKFIHNNSGKFTYKNDAGDTCLLSSDDPRVLSGEYKFLNTGTVFYRSKLTGAYKHFKKTDIIPDEYEAFSTGKSTYILKDGSHLFTTKDDPRVASGNAVNRSANTAYYILNGKTRRLRTDDPRIKELGLKSPYTNMVQCYKLSELDNPDKKFIMMSRDDERYKSGEYVSFASNRIVVKHIINGDKKRIFKCDLEKYIALGYK